MAWARLDDGFHDHPKVDQLSLSAVGLYTLCLTWAHRHRKTAIVAGHITEARVRKIAGKQADALAAELVTSGMWETEPNIGGYVIHDFSDYLPKERDPEERREAGRKGAAKKWEGHSKQGGNLPDASLATDGSRASAPAFPSRPVPNVELTKGGERPVTLQAAPAPPPPKTRSRCTRHPDGNPTDEPCDGCRRERELEVRRAARETEQHARAFERARIACTRCDGAKVINPDGTPSTRRCDHGLAAVASVTQRETG